MRIGLHMSQMYALAKPGQDISGYDAEVDKHNAWIRQNFGNDRNLMMAKMPETGDGIPKMQETGDGLPKIQGTESVMPGYFPIPWLTTIKPIHAIDASLTRRPPHSLPA
jgi:hypothetical protein